APARSWRLEARWQRGLNAAEHLVYHLAQRELTRVYHYGVGGGRRLQRVLLVSFTQALGYLTEFAAAFAGPAQGADLGVGGQEELHAGVREHGGAHVASVDDEGALHLTQA